MRVMEIMLAHPQPQQTATFAHTLGEWSQEKPVHVLEVLWAENNKVILWESMSPGSFRLLALVWPAEGQLGSLKCGVPGRTACHAGLKAVLLEAHLGVAELGFKPRSV